MGLTDSFTIQVKNHAAGDSERPGQNNILHHGDGTAVGVSVSDGLGESGKLVFAYLGFRVSHVQHHHAAADNIVYFHIVCISLENIPHIHFIVRTAECKTMHFVHSLYLRNYGLDTFKIFRSDFLGRRQLGEKSAELISSAFQTTLFMLGGNAVRLPAALDSAADRADHVHIAVTGGGDDLSIYVAAALNGAGVGPGALGSTGGLDHNSLAVGMGGRDSLSVYIAAAFNGAGVDPGTVGSAGRGGHDSLGISVGGRNDLCVHIAADSAGVGLGAVGGAGGGDYDRLAVAVAGSRDDFGVHKAADSAACGHGAFSLTAGGHVAGLAVCMLCHRNGGSVCVAAGTGIGHHALGSATGGGGDSGLMAVYMLRLGVLCGNYLLLDALLALTLRGLSAFELTGKGGNRHGHQHQHSHTESKELSCNTVHLHKYSS